MNAIRAIKSSLGIHDEVKGIIIPGHVLVTVNQISGKRCLPIIEQVSKTQSGLIIPVEVIYGR